MEAKTGFETVEEQGQKVTSRVEEEVLRRYGDGAEQMEAGLCCPTEYDTSLLRILPQEIIDKDYGCGDPSKYVTAGETVLDLGSGAGKICYILSQKVGAEGQVIGVDFNDRMLDLALKYQGEMAEKIGYGNVEFRKGKIQDLALNLDLAATWLKANPVTTVEEAHTYEAECERLRREAPLVETDAIDVIVSNCVLNLVRPGDKKQLFQEMHRVLKPGGRAVISDIVCDQDPTAAILADPELWSGCISGAFREDLFLKMFEEAGFYGMEILVRQDEPWHVIDGVEFRSMTVRAYKRESSPCWERKQALVYHGPWKSVTDDDGHIFPRGERMAVCDKTFRIMTESDGPYGGQFEGIEPLDAVPLESAPPFDCARRDNTHRDPSETKGTGYKHTQEGPQDSCCGPEGCC